MWAQDLAYQGNPDESFFNARQMAFSGKRTQARDTLNRILEAYPNYADVRNLLAKTLSWEGKYDQARKEFNKITSKERRNLEVWEAAIKNEIYAQNLTVALGLCNKALKYLPLDARLQRLKSQVLVAMDVPDMAQEYIDNYRVRHPKDVAVQGLQKQLDEQVRKQEIEVGSTLEVYDIVYDPAVTLSLRYAKESEWGKWAVQTDFANRFNTNGLQIGGEVYPKFGKDVYADVAYAYSGATIFPRHRARAEVYKSFPNKMEASLGGRFYDFSDSSSSLIYTGSLGLYSGDYYFSARPYVTPIPDAKPSFSMTLTARRYGKKPKQYLGLVAGYGFMPDFKQLVVDGELLSKTVLYLESRQFFLDYQMPAAKGGDLWKFQLGVQHQELVFDADRFYWSVSAGLRFTTRF